jgi:hypothetical protein
MYRAWHRALEKIGGLGVLIAVFLPGLVNAQVTIGDNTNLSLSGQIGAGYSGAYGNENFASSHGMFFTGLADLNGYYYNPRFLNFSVLPFYNRNQDNSSIQSIFNESGIGATVNLFGGSHFPGSIAYSAGWTQGSQFEIAGQPGLSANGTSQNFSVNWSALFPKWPTLTATFSDNSLTDTIIGETGTTTTKGRVLTLSSNYNWDGYQFFALYSHQNFDFVAPQFISGSNFETTSSNNSFGVSVSHPLPLHGSWSAAYSRFTYDNGGDVAVGNTGASDTVIGSVALNPTRRLGVSGTFRYYDNLFGTFQNGTLPPGTVPIGTFNTGVNGYTLNTFASYGIGKGFTLVGYANEQRQHFQGQEYTNSQYGATLTYSYARPLLGLLYFSFGMVNTAGNGNQGTIAFVGNLGLKKNINGWDISADGSYAQNVQSSIALFTTSNYSYGGAVHRRFRDDINWVVSYRGVQSGITQITGYNNRSDTAIMNITRRWLGLSGSYSQSNGTSVLTNTGTLVPTPLPPITTLEQVLYNGTAYGAGLGLSPLRGMVINLNWYHVHNQTNSTLGPNAIGTFSNNDNNRIYGEMQYNFRKLIFRATYWRINQFVSVSGTPRVVENTYTFSISRWFNFF